MLLVYITTKDFTEAERIATHLLENRLAAGANIFPPMLSMYHWQGKIERHEECACIFKTTQENFAELKTSVLQLHSYKTPCIIALPAEAEAAFATWIKQECKSN